MTQAYGLRSIGLSEESPYGGRLMFAQSWEDPACDRTALGIRPGDCLVAITSGGDNVLEFLCDDPARIIAVDINPTQAWLFELKAAAFRLLDHSGLLDLVGVTQNNSSASLYAAIRKELSRKARAFFDERKEWFERGLLQQGGFERYFAILRRIIVLAVGRQTVERLFSIDPSEQERFYRTEWDRWRWRVLMKIGCSKWLLGNRLDPTWFADSETADFGSHFLQLAEHVLTELPAAENYFLSQILRGRYSGEVLPNYLSRDNFETIRDRIDRVELVVSGIEDGLRHLPTDAVDAFSLSNVFEYSPRRVFEESKTEIVRVGRSGARIAHRNLLNPLRLSEDMRFKVDLALSEKLQNADRGFIYSRFEAARLA